MSALSFDHVIIGVADLEAAAAALGRVLGRTPSWRGRHPTYGTANVLFRLGSAYVELLAPDAALAVAATMPTSVRCSALILPSKPSVVFVIIEAMGGKVSTHFPA